MTSAGDYVAVGDMPVVTLPRGLTAARWRAYREAHPPAYLRPENRWGETCGVCGGPLGPLTRMCVACHRAELQEAKRR